MFIVLYQVEEIQGFEQCETEGEVREVLDRLFESGMKKDTINVHYISANYDLEEFNRVKKISKVDGSENIITVKQAAQELFESGVWIGTTQDIKEMILEGSVMFTPFAHYEMTEKKAERFTVAQRHGTEEEEFSDTIFIIGEETKVLKWIDENGAAGILSNDFRTMHEARTWFDATRGTYNNFDYKKIEIE